MTYRHKVSICVPVYNTESYLAYFLDSAINQTFDDYEIVAVDNCSTDNSYAILLKYQNAYPEKLLVYQTDTHGTAGKARNMAVNMAGGEYIYMCDSDDVIWPLALKTLYRKALETGADLVCASAVQVTEENNEIRNVTPLPIKRAGRLSNEAAIVSGVEFWLRLIKRSLWDKSGQIPEDVVFDDVRFLTVLQSYAEKIYYTPVPIYCWFKRGTSSTTLLRKEVCEDSAEAAKYILSYANPDHIDAVQMLVGNRLKYGLDYRWPYFDQYIEELQGYTDWLYKNALIKNNKPLFNKLRWADSLADIHFPNIIYVDGFAAAPMEERLAELREKVFHDVCEIVVLSPENCDLNENEYVKRAYERGDLALVTGYFALKSIYENGGVFIHNNIRILNYFSYLKYQNAFFALIDKTTYSEWIYGAPVGNEAIAAILKTFSDAWDKKGEYMSLSERISIVLCGKYGIPLDGKERLFGKIVSVLPPALSVADTRFGDITKKCAFEHDFSAYAGDPNYITLSRTSLRVLMAPSASGPAGKSARERALEKELADMKATNTYKLMMKIRAIGDGPHGPFLKKIFHWILRVRKKLLRK